MLFLTSREKGFKSEFYNYLRKLLHSDGIVVSRIEFSFYGNVLFKPNAYNGIISKLFIGQRTVFDCLVFR